MVKDRCEGDAAAGLIGAEMMVSSGETEGGTVSLASSDVAPKDEGGNMG